MNNNHTSYPIPTRLAFGDISTSEHHAAFIIPWYRNSAGNVIVGFVFRKDGTFGFPGGKVEDGETLRQAAVRECVEEIGYEIDPDSLQCNSSSHQLSNGLVVHAFHKELYNGATSARGISRHSMDATHAHEHFGLVWVDWANSKHFHENAFASAVKLELEDFLIDNI